ncbi:hypothetical protein EVG20_g3548 [Dentipellis fragilis]|uniref:C2H2-type domain-containing protein n=1 Tax=Dentipellis fragilis TaxID=205917 RepID=A0A4Y9Z1H3_9AGAM|nr:hypothetical protein EVG20_g3548 [Dentipellis fragilis]
MVKAKSCPECGTVVLGVKALKAHHELFHLTFLCSTCDKRFAKEEEIKAHFKFSQMHPDCPRCDEGFEDGIMLEIHRITHHEFLRCGVCNIAVSVDGLGDHYLKSPNHPSCTFCNIGFPGPLEFNEHCTHAHTNLFCISCQEMFDSSLLRHLHFFLSDAHPKCYLCQRAFQDDEGMANHQCPLAKRVFQQFKPSAVGVDPVASTSEVKASDVGLKTTNTEITHLQDPAPQDQRPKMSRRSSAPDIPPRPSSETTAPPTRETLISEASAYIDRYLSGQPRSPTLIRSLAPSVDDDTRSRLSDWEVESVADDVPDPRPKQYGDKADLPRIDRSAPQNSGERHDDESRRTTHIYCRLCRLDPCEDATATMCGHVFCNRPDTNECNTAYNDKKYRNKVWTGNAE